MPTTIDDLDRKIIVILQRDGRTPYADMGRTLSVAEGTIRRRVENLIAEGVIHIAAWADPYKVGIEVVVLINLDVDLAHLEDVSPRGLLRCPVCGLWPIRRVFMTSLLKCCSRLRKDYCAS